MNVEAAKKLGDEAAYPVDCDAQGQHVIGLTKRELFAARVMQGIMSNASENTIGAVVKKAEELGISSREYISMESAKQADALLAELAKETPCPA